MAKMTKNTDFRLSKEYHDDYIVSLFQQRRQENVALGGVAILIVLLMVMAIMLMGCGEAKAMDASWYSVSSLHKDGQWKITKGVMANGRQFSDSGFTAASRDWPLGTKVKVTRTDNKASVVVLVADRTAKRFKGTRIDLSPIAFSRLAPLEQGIVAVRVEEVI
jgi:rare lipoprotein A (peptidoglycan hydrolase)